MKTVDDLMVKTMEKIGEAVDLSKIWDQRRSHYRGAVDDGMVLETREDLIVNGGREISSSVASYVCSDGEGRRRLWCRLGSQRRERGGGDAGGEVAEEAKEGDVNKF